MTWIHMQCLTFLLLGGVQNIISTNQVLRPIKTTNTENVGIIIVAGGGLYYDQYILLGQTLQRASDQMLWVCLSNNDLEESIPTNDTYIGQCILAMQEAGLPAEADIIAYGHSYGAVLVMDEILNNPHLVTGTVLLGATVLSSSEFEALPVPVLTANGDLDGQTRITQHMQSFQHVQHNVEHGEASYMRSFPHVVLEGVNHCQYVTGQRPDRVVRFWIESDLDTLESCDLVANVTLPFVEMLTSTNSSITDTARAIIDNYYNETLHFMQPLLSAFLAEEDIENGISPWAVQAQYIIADVGEETKETIAVQNKVVSRTQLALVEPEITIEDTMITAQTYTSVYRPSFPESGEYEGAYMLESKHKSEDAVFDAVEGGSEPSRSTILCRDINKEAFSWVWNELVNDVQKQRYHSRNITVEFLEDVFTSSENEWLDSDFKFEFDGDHLSIQSSNFITSMEQTSNSGMHHCKMLSPAKAIEFIYVDALYETFYSDQMLLN